MIVLTLYGWGASEEEYEVHKGIQKDSVMVMGQSHSNEWYKAEGEEQAKSRTEESITEDEEHAEPTSGETMGETDEMQAEEDDNDPLDNKSDKSTMEQQKKSESQEESEKPQNLEKQQEESEQQQVGDESSASTGATIRKAVILTKALNVRKKAKKDATVILILERGMELDLLEEYEDGWAKIRYEGKEGYVYSEYIEPID